MSQGSAFDELRISIKRWVEAALGTFRELPREIVDSETGYRMVQVVYRTHDEFNAGGTTYVREPIFLGLIRHNEETIRTLPEYQALAGLVGTDRSIAKWVAQRLPEMNPVTPQTIAYVYYVNTLEPLLEVVTKETYPEFDWDSAEPLLDGVLDRIHAELEGAQVKLTAIAPLYRFSLDLDKLELTPNLRIRTLTDADRNRWLDSIDLQETGGKSFWSHLHPVAAVEVDRIALPDQSAEIEQDIVQVLTALRLYKKGGLAAAGILVESPDQWRLYPPAIWPLSHVRASMSGPGINLDQQEADDFKQFWKAYAEGIRAAEEHTQIQIALRRFDRAASDEPLEDRLIDCCIGLDALFTPGVDSELTYRLIQQAAFFLGTNSEGRRQITSFLQEIYKARGAVVHGEQTLELLFRKPSKLFKNAESLVDEAIDLLRTSLLGWLSLFASDPEELRGFLVGRGKVDVLLRENVLQCGALVQQGFSKWVRVR